MFEAGLRWRVVAGPRSTSLGFPPCRGRSPLVPAKGPATTLQRTDHHGWSPGFFVYGVAVFILAISSLLRLAQPWSSATTSGLSDVTIHTSPCRVSA